MEAGANPEVGGFAAEESFEYLKTLLTTQTKMVFITAGGWRNRNRCRTHYRSDEERNGDPQWVLSPCFPFEGKLHWNRLKRFENIKKIVDALIVINNNKLREVYGNLGFKAGFSKADEVLSTAARGIAEVITHHYRQNIDLLMLKQSQGQWYSHHGIRFCQWY